MATTEFLTFSIGPLEETVDQVTYAGADWRINGWRSGILPHRQINKVLRQTSAISSAIAQVIADVNGANLPDDKNQVLLIQKAKDAFSASLPFNATTNYPAGTIGHAIKSGTYVPAPTAEQIKSAIAGQLTESELTTALRNRLNQIDAPTTGLVTKVSDLQTAYGSTVSAAQSAADAAQAEIDAIAAANAAALSAAGAGTSASQAATSATNAATSASAASTSATSASTSATNAAGSASSASTQATNAANSATAANASANAAASSASSAATSATDAGTYAAAADSSRLQAATQASNASTSASNAATSATSAAGSAATATTKASQASTSEANAAASASAAATSATTAATQATNAGTSASLASTKALEASTSATNAANSATAASTSASNAQTSSTNAASSASAANTSAVSAAASATQASTTLSAMTRRNLAMRRNANADSGAPSAAIINTDWGTSGWGLRLTTPGSSLFAVASVLNLGTAPNTAYSVSFRAKIISGGTSATLWTDFWPDTLPDNSRTINATDTLYKWENVSSSSADWNTARVRFFSNTNGVVIEITDIKVEQNTIATDFVVAPDDAPFYASAAAGSAQSASASATGAANSASAASSSATAAASSAGAASTSASQASTSASNAAGSASAASTSATNAANSATAASGSATAANTSASNAQTSANNASSSASAAATHYNNTVSATGTLTASVNSLSSTVSTLQGNVNTASAQYVLKVGVTRSDGKQVFAGIGLASTSNGSIGQSEILLQADRLVFVASGSTDATPKQLLTVGTVNGVATLVVNAAMIGDATIGSAQVGTLTADKIALNSGSAAQGRESFFGLSWPGSGTLGGGGGYSILKLGNTITYIGYGSLFGISLGGVTLPYAGQMMAALATGYAEIALATNWGGPASPTLSGLRLRCEMRVMRLSGGAWSEYNTRPTIIEDDQMRNFGVGRKVKIPFSIMEFAKDAPAGTYDVVLAVEAYAYQGTGTTPLFCFDGSNSRVYFNSFSFGNSV